MSKRKACRNAIPNDLSNHVDNTSRQQGPKGLKRERNTNPCVRDVVSGDLSDRATSRTRHPPKQDISGDRKNSIQIEMNALLFVFAIIKSFYFLVHALIRGLANKEGI